MRKALSLSAAILPILVALAVAFLAMRYWILGGKVFGVSLAPPSDVDDWAKLLGFTFGIPAAVLALFTYIRGVNEQQRANLWKRREYLAQRFDRLESLPSCKAVMRMLDYNATYVDLDGLEGRIINDRLVMSALAPHQQRGSYTPQEQIIRDAFDAFLGELDRVGAMAAAGLLSEKDLSAFADYWLRLFKPEERDRLPVYGAVLRRYVRVFHFKSLARLLQARGLMNITGPKAAQAAKNDDGIIAAFEPTWVAPEPVKWEHLIEQIETSLENEASAP